MKNANLITIHTCIYTEFMAAAVVYTRAHHLLTTRLYRGIYYKQNQIGNISPVAYFSRITSTMNSQEDRHEQRFCSYIKHTAHVIGNSMKLHGASTLKAFARFRPVRMMLISFAGSQTCLKMLHLFIRYGPAICSEDLVVKRVISQVLGDNPRPWKQQIAELSLRIVVLPIIRRNPFFAACITQKVILYLLRNPEKSQLRLIIFTLGAVFSVAVARSP